ncbi:MAG: hypothetical protein IPP35_02030 [Elusimicrobia bacterium]|nr:hypothetical protein [Elusimicrobiota bacterium]
MATASIADGEIKNTAEINPLKINGGTFQNESYTFPGLLKPNGWIGRDATNDKMNIFGAPYDVDSGRIELWGKDAPNNQGNVSLIASDENAGPTSGGKIVFTTYHPSGGLGNDYLVRVIISSAGYVGIGTVNPLERLDLADGSIKIINATTTANAPSPGLISRSGLTFPIASPLGGNVYLNDFGFGFIQESLTSDSAYISGGGIRFFTNQQQYLTIGGSGNVRVSSTAFQVDGTGGSLKVGGQGTPVTAYLSATQSLDFPSMAKNTTAELTLTVTGAAVGDTVALGPPGTLPADLMAMAYVSAGNTVTVRLANIGGGSIDPAAATYRVSVIRH